MRDGLGSAGTRVTLIVTARERFGLAQASLTGILDNTAEPYRLVYVDSGGPKRLRRWLREQADRRGFDLVSVDRFLSPNEARNIGLRHATTRYVVFIDNDIIPSPGWLETIMRCADETGADVVSPLVCEGWPLHHIVHQAGGRFTGDIANFFAARPGTRIFDERLNLAGRPATLVRPERVPSQLCEFHCMLARRDLFDRLGPLDEEMLATREHIDFCMGVAAAGGKIVFEPRSVVTFLDVPYEPLRLRDWPFYLVRWSAEWQRRSIDRFQAKWGLDPEQACFRNREKRVWFRYNDGLIRPFVRRLPFTKRSSIVRRASTRIVAAVARVLGGALRASTDRRRATAERRLRSAGGNAGGRAIDADRAEPGIAA